MLPTSKTKVSPKANKTTKPKNKQSKAAGANKDKVKGIEVTIKESNEEKEVDLKKKTRAQNYAKRKDLQLCNSWLETTKDGRKGTNESGDVFWEMVSKHYRKQIPEPERSTKSLKNCWSIIQHAINKYHGCLQMNHCNQSGTTSNNQTTMALLLYGKIQGQLFPYISCYKILINLAKWNAYHQNLEKKTNPKRDESSPPPSSGPATTRATSDASGDHKGKDDVLTRPIGRKKAKLEYQEQQLDVSNHKELKKMVAAHCEIANVAKKQQMSLDSQNTNLQCLANEAIMSQDLSGASDMVKRYYELEQKTIMERLEAEMAKKTIKPQSFLLFI
jgi:hypothetical protein